MKFKDIEPGKTYKTRRHSWRGGDLVRVLAFIDKRRYQWSKPIKKLSVTRLIIDKKTGEVRDSGWHDTLMPNQIERELTVEQYIEEQKEHFRAAREAQKKRDQMHADNVLMARQFVDALVKAGFPEPKFSASHSGMTVGFDTKEIKQYHKEKETR